MQLSNSLMPRGKEFADEGSRTDSSAGVSFPLALNDFVVPRVERRVNAGHSSGFGTACILFCLVWFGSAR